MNRIQWAPRPWSHLAEGCCTMMWKIAIFGSPTHDLYRSESECAIPITTQHLKYDNIPNTFYCIILLLWFSTFSGRSGIPMVPFFSVLRLLFHFFIAATFVLLQSNIIVLGLPGTFFLFIRPSKTVLSSESLRNTYPIHFFCLLLIVLTSVRSSSTAFSTSSFVLCSVQPIFRSLYES